MAILKMTNEMLVEVLDKKTQYHLSVPQCCLYLFNKYGVDLSRQTMAERMEKKRAFG